MGGRRTFGSARQLPSGRWQASYWHNGRRHVGRLTFPTKADANAYLSTIESAVRRGGWVDPAGSRLLVRELADRWEAHNPAKRQSSRDRDEAIIRLHIVPVIGDVRIGDVTPPDVQQLVNAWAATKAPRTAVRHYATVKAMFAYAVASDWLVRSPCRGIKLPVVEPASRRPVTPEEVAMIVAAMEERYRPMVWVAALLGLRWGEVAGLTVASLDLLGRTVTVRQQLDRYGDLVPPKSRAGHRPLSIPSALAEILTGHLQAMGLTAADPDALVFTTPDGHALDYTNWRQRAWVPTVDAVGLPGVGMHDLRRTNATVLVTEGVDVKTAQARLGHSDPRLTLAVYAQATTEADRQAAERLGRRFFPEVERSAADSEPGS